MSSQVSKKKRNSFKKEIAKRLRAYGRILYDGEVIANKKPFEDAANQCEKGPMPVSSVNSSNSWGYELSNFVLKIPKKERKKGVYPEGAVSETISVSAVVIGNFTRKDYAEDPFVHLEFNIVVNGKDLNGEPMVNSWHLDRHLENGQGDHNEPEDIHPIYHFQYGGEKLRLPKNDYGTHLVLDTPRLMHLPLDAVLGVDFVLANFLGSIRSNLCSKRTYSDCIRDSQIHIWRPYIHSIARQWTNYGDDMNRYEWDRTKICPQLL